MGFSRQACKGCNQKFPLTELHIDPATSEWYCDPCFNMMVLERDGEYDSNPPGEDWSIGQDDDDE